MIDMYRSLFLCLLDLAVHGSITVLVAGIEEAQAFVTDAMQGLRSTIQSAVSGVNSAIDNTVGLIDKIPRCARTPSSFQAPAHRDTSAESTSTSPKSTFQSFPHSKTSRYPTRSSTLCAT